MRTLRFSAILCLAALLGSGCSAIIDGDLYGYGAVAANAGTDQVVDPSSNVTLDATASTQSAGKTLHFRWEQVAGTPVTLANATSASATFTAPATLGALGFVVHVDDGGPGETTDDVTVTVDSSPVVALGPDIETMTKTPIYLDATSVFDPDLEVVTFTWTQTGGQAVTLVGADTPVASFTTGRDSGTVTFHVEACDALGQCRGDDISVIVRKWVQISAGSGHVGLLRSDGTAWGFGSGSDGILGPATTSRTYPVRINDLAGVTQVRATDGATFTTAGGVLYAQGLNLFGSLGITPASTSEVLTVATPVDAALQGARSVQHTRAAGLFVTASGALVTTGYNYYGELGTCTIAPYQYPASYTVPVPSVGAQWARVFLGKVANPTFGFAVTSGGYAYSWGQNSAGQLGNGTAMSGACAAPSQNNYIYGEPIAVATSQSSVALVNASGSLYSWGSRQADGTANLIQPTQRGAFTDWLDVAATSTGAMFAIRENGMLYSWGEGSTSELGLGDEPPVDRFPSPANAAPFRIGTDSDWVGVAATDANGFALKSDGSIWGWGPGNTPLVGNGLYPPYSATYRRSPAQLVATAPGFCGDGIVGSGYAEDLATSYDETCDDGPRNGSPGACSASCRCPATRAVFVDVDATGSGDGTSWTNAFRSIQPALDLAGLCDTIWVAEGTYVPPASPANGAVATLGAKAEIYGGFAGFETYFAQRDTARHQVILDGGGTSHHVVVAGDGGVIDGFVIRGGAATASAPNDVGGGLLVTATGEVQFVVRDVTFADNHAAVAGGGVYANDVTGAARRLVIDRSRFVDNTAVAGGGAAFGGGSFRVVDSVFVSNRAEGATATNRNGGAVNVSSVAGYVALVNSAFVGNSAVDAGSAVWVGLYNAYYNASLAFLTAYGNTGGGAAIHFNGYPDSDDGGVESNHVAAWNPGSASEMYQLGVVFSCFQDGRSPSPSGTGNVTSVTDPFAFVGSGDSAAIYLSANSACRNIGAINFARNVMPWWSQRWTTSDRALDSGNPDAGFHWFSP